MDDEKEVLRNIMLTEITFFLLTHRLNSDSEWVVLEPKQQRKNVKKFIDQESRAAIAPEEEKS
jgi:hypothetical protein